MGRGDVMGCTLALVAILAIIAGNLKPAVGKRELLANLQWDVGAWKIVNDLEVSLKVHCYEQKRDLRTAVIEPSLFWFHQWALDPNYREIFSCDFELPGGSMQQSFMVWAHDDPNSYLYTCSSCQWKVQEDGFYFLQADGQFVRKWEWTPSNS